jgi:dolichol-phosphate mannosyltransferase
MIAFNTASIERIMSGSYDVSVIIPTLNEAANIQDIITEINSVLLSHNIRGEIVVVDDDSTDGTISKAAELKKTIPGILIIARKSDHGLSQSVVDGFTWARSDIFIVMDADHSHPPALIPDMYNGIKSGNDIVIGSRYMEGGGIKDWPLKRRIISAGATFLGRLLFPSITDPVSGFFAVRKSVVLHAPLKPKGYKILLEVLGKGVWKKIQELPYEFVDRAAGSSKLKIKTIIEYATQVIDIVVFSLTHSSQSILGKEWEKFAKFGVVGISGIFVNMIFLYYLTDHLGIFYLISSLIAIEVSILNNFVWNDTWTFYGSENLKLDRWPRRMVLFHIISIGGLIINIGILYLLTGMVGVYYLHSNLAGILAAFGWNFIMNRRLTWVDK